MILMKGEYLPLIISVFCFLIPIITLLFVVVVKQIIKRSKKPKKENTTKDTKKSKTSSEKNEKPEEVKYIDFFGGSDNVVSASKNMTRVTIEVVDLDKVQFDKLRQLGIGVLITGNIVKCSSEEFAKQIGE